MKETGGLVCRCGTWFLKQAGVFSRLLNFSSPGSSSGGRAVLPLLRWALLEDKCWGAPASAVESEFSHHGGLCLSGYFTWYSHCKCTVQDCGLRSIAPFCFIERDIYCSCLINGTQAKTVPVTDSLQLLLRSVQWNTLLLFIWVFFPASSTLPMVTLDTVTDLIDLSMISVSGGFILLQLLFVPCISVL